MSESHQVRGPARHAGGGSGLVVFDGEGRILHVTRALLSLWSYESPGALIDHDVVSLWADPAEWREALARAAPGQNHRAFLDARTADGAALRMEVLLEPAANGLTTALCQPAANAPGKIWSPPQRVSFR